MALDFPASPTVGQKYPQPAVSGVPVYTWDGEKWTTLGGAIGSTGASDAIPLIDAGTGAAGSSTLWSRGDHVHPPTAVVRYDIAQSLTAPQQQQARQNIYAAPFDAMAYSGLQINGAMDVSQELGVTGVTLAGKFACDGWALIKVGTAAVTLAQQPITIFPGLPNYLAMSVQTAQASMGAGDLATALQNIEGLRCSRLAWGTVNAQPITLAFWSAHHRAGLYSGSVRNGPNNRSYAFTYTQAAADTPQYNTVTIPGDTTGTWNIDNTAGISISFAAACGATFTAPSAGSWFAGNYVAAPGQINAVAATSDVFRLTGVIVHPGNEAPSAARSPFVMRPYSEELRLCQRYWQLVTTSLRYMNFTATPTTGAATHSLPVEMRAAPTTTILAGGSPNNVTAYTVVAQSAKELLVTMTAAAAIADTYMIGRTFSCDARL